MFFNIYIKKNITYYLINIVTNTPIVIWNLRKRSYLKIYLKLLSSSILISFLYKLNLVVKFLLKFFKRPNCFSDFLLLPYYIKYVLYLLLLYILKFYI